MKAVRTYFSVPEAGLARSKLLDAGIQATIFDEASATIGYGSAFGGVRLMVADRDLEEAEAILEESTPLPDDAELEIPEAEDEPELESGPHLGMPWPIGSFLQGGIFTVGGCVLLSVAFSLTGGRFTISPGGLALLFVAGGLAGYFLRRQFEKARHSPP